MLFQSEGEWEPEGKMWVVTGVRPVLVTPKAKVRPVVDVHEEEEEEESTTPTAREARIPEMLPCPPAPRKRRPAAVGCKRSDVEFFVPPELETVFVCRTGSS